MAHTVHCRQTLFRFLCVTTVPRSVLLFSKIVDSTFVSTRFCNRRKVLVFSKTQNKPSTCQSVLKLNSKQNIASQLDNMHINRNRSYVDKHL